MLVQKPAMAGVIRLLNDNLSTRAKVICIAKDRLFFFQNLNINAMLSLKCIWVFLSYFLLAACSSADKTKNEGGLSTANTTQKWKVLASGTLCDIRNPKQVLIKKQTDFDKLWQETFANNSGEIQKPIIDFTTEWVIAAYLGKVNSGGHSIEIKKENNVNKIVVTHHKPGRGCATATVIQYPYTFVSTEHFLLDKAEFKIVLEEYKCE